MEGDTRILIDELRREIRDMRRAMFGDESARQKGLFDRLEGLEKKFDELSRTYDREKIETGAMGELEDKLDQLQMDYRIAVVYVRGLVATTATITVTMLGAAVVAILRYLMGGPT